MRLPYEVVDVFTDRAYAGNPLAVVFGAEELTTAQGQAMADEFHLSETVFLLPTSAAAAGRADYRVRIFTPAAELPFAGHPSVGGGWVQRRRGVVTTDRWVMECGAGLLPMTARSDGTIELTGGTPSVGAPFDCGTVAALLIAAGLPGNASVPGLSVRSASTGSPFVVVPVTEASLLAARPGATLAAALGASTGLLLLAWADGAAHVRMFAPGVGVSEDPATGSAATALGAYLAAERLVGEGETSYVVSQGAEIGRPSTLYASVVVEAGVATECRVAGHVVAVASGEIEVPAP